MSVMKRVSLIFKSKANKALDRMEDPRETLDYSYQRQLEMLTQVRRGVADVATSRKRVELQMKSLQQNQNKLEGQAKQALGPAGKTWPGRRWAAGQRWIASLPTWRTSTTRCRPTRKS